MPVILITRSKSRLLKHTGTLPEVPPPNRRLWYLRKMLTASVRVRACSADVHGLFPGKWRVFLKPLSPVRSPIADTLRKQERSRTVGDPHVRCVRLQQYIVSLRILLRWLSNVWRGIYFELRMGWPEGPCAMQAQVIYKAFEVLDEIGKE